MSSEFTEVKFHYLLFVYVKCVLIHGILSDLKCVIIQTPLLLNMEKASHGSHFAFEKKYHLISQGKFILLKINQLSLI